MGNTSFLARIPEEQRKLGTPVCTRKDSNKLDLEETGWDGTDCQLSTIIRKLNFVTTYKHRTLNTHLICSASFSTRFVASSFSCPFCRSRFSNSAFFLNSLSKRSWSDFCSRFTESSCWRYMADCFPASSFSRWYSATYRQPVRATVPWNAPPYNAIYTKKNYSNAVQINVSMCFILHNEQMNR